MQSHFGVELQENASFRVMMEQTFVRRLDAMRYTLGHDVGLDYSDIDAVTEEVKEVRRMIVSRRWPMIDVTSRSIGQTATMIMELLQRHREAAG